MAYLMLFFVAGYVGMDGIFLAACLVFAAASLVKWARENGWFESDKK